MLVYIVMLLISLIFAYLSQSINNSTIQKIFRLLSCLPFLVIASIRYDVGTDYLYRYVPEFIKICSGQTVWNYEFGFTILNKIILLFTNKYVWLFIISSIMIYIPLFHFIYKKSKQPILSIIVFFTCGYFFQSLNIVREYIAIIYVLYSLDYLLEKKYFKWLFLILIACSFHLSAIVFIITPLFIKKNVFNLKNFTLLTVFILLFNSFIKDFIYFLLSYTKFSVYIGSGYDKPELKETLLILNILIYIYMYISYLIKKKNGSMTPEENLLINIQGISIIFVLLGVVSYLFFRISFYFSIFQIISIPLFLENYPSKKSLNIIIILGMMGYLMYTNVLNNLEEVTPYKTIFGGDIYENICSNT